MPFYIEASRLRPMLRILSVDPNLLNRRVVEGFLHGRGDLLDFAADGEEAITAVSTRAYDVVLMELRLPGLSGYETTRRIRNLATPMKLVTIIAVTTYSFRGTRAECLAAGMDDHLTIPLSRDALLKALDQVDPADRRTTPSDLARISPPGLPRFQIRGNVDHQIE